MTTWLTHPCLDAARSYRPPRFMQSPFQQFLGTNYVPTDIEVERIRAELASHKAALARIEGLIHNLSAERDRLKDYIGSHRALISHPRRLPQDVVQEIFLACLPADRNAAMRRTEAPLLLCRICSYWRTVALSMRRLWASLDVSADFSSRNCATAVAEWLERSDPLPLSLSLRWRWSHSVIASFHHRSDKTQVLSSILMKGTNLQNITIYTPRHVDLLPSGSFTWDHLVYLTLDYRDHSPSLIKGLSTQQAYQLLSGCPRLVSLEFHLDWKPTPLLSGMPLSLPFLQSLSLLGHRFVIPSLLANLLEHLVMPSMRNFWMPPSHGGRQGLMADPSDIEFLTHLAERSPGMSSIRLDPSAFTTDSLLETLRCFASLKTIHAVRSWTTNDAKVANTLHLIDLLTPDPETLAPKVC
ncbi:hypothetical protein DFH09DRAFT_1152418 [Mycena vulgaris]|nr:hypothetical protein DFH09DRAFT_1152418 [Mycena vulgaris]